MQRRFHVILFLIIVVHLSTALAAMDEMRSRVEEILLHPTLGGAQTIKMLIALGLDAAPILAEKLWTYEFTGTLMDVLAEFRDPRTTPLLLQYLEEKRDDTAINVLKEIGDQRAEEPLLKIVRSEKADLETRLTAAAAVTRFGTPTAKKECEIFIMDIWHCDQSHDCQYPGPFYNGMTLYGALQEALLEVDTEEAFHIVLGWLKDNDTPLLQKEIIAVFTKNNVRKC